jgi:hypothetical protein
MKKYYDIVYKKPIVHDEGHPALGTMWAVEYDESASIDDVRNSIKELIGFGAPWDANGLEIVSIVPTPEEGLPRPLPDDAIVD